MGGAEAAEQAEEETRAAQQLGRDIRSATASCQLGTQPSVSHAILVANGRAAAAAACLAASSPCFRRWWWPDADNVVGPQAAADATGRGRPPTPRCPYL